MLSFDQKVRDGNQVRSAVICLRIADIFNVVLYFLVIAIVTKIFDIIQGQESKSKSGFISKRSVAFNL